MKISLSRTDSTEMYRRAFARHRTGAALLLGLSLRAPSASAEPAEPDETRVGLRGGTATVRVESSRHLPQQTNDQLVPGDEARVSFVLSPRVELPGVAAAALEAAVRGQRSAPGVLSHTREEVRFGRFAGGAVSAQTRGPEPALPGEANSSLFDVGGLIETPFARGRGSLLAALLFLLSPEVQLEYRGYQTRAPHEPSARDRFGVFGFGSYDLPGEKRNGILRRLGDACRPRITFTW